MTEDPNIEDLDWFYNTCKDLQDAAKYDEEDLLDYVSPRDLEKLSRIGIELVQDVAKLKAEIYKLRDATIYNK